MSSVAATGPKPSAIGSQRDSMSPTFPSWNPLQSDSDASEPAGPIWKDVVAVEGSQVPLMGEEHRSDRQCEKHRVGKAANTDRQLAVAQNAVGGGDGE